MFIKTILSHHLPSLLLPRIKLIPVLKPISSFITTGQLIGLLKHTRRRFRSTLVVCFRCGFVENGSGFADVFANGAGGRGLALRVLCEKLCVYDFELWNSKSKL